jgi:hypothetical protein
MPYNKGGLRSAIYAPYSWEIALNIEFDVWFYDM